MHRTLEERCIAAQKMASSVDLSGFHVTVDTMLNGANIAYGAIPIRLYIVQDKRVAYQGGAGPLFYRMHEVSEWLQKYREKLSRIDERIRDRGWKGTVVISDMENIRTRQLQTKSRMFRKRTRPLPWKTVAIALGSKTSPSQRRFHMILYHVEHKHPCLCLSSQIYVFTLDVSWDKTS